MTVKKARTARFMQCVPVKLSVNDWLYNWGSGYQSLILVSNLNLCLLNNSLPQEVRLGYDLIPIIILAYYFVYIATHVLSLAGSAVAKTQDSRCTIVVDVPKSTLGCGACPLCAPPRNYQEPRVDERVVLACEW